jgi:DNA-binding transcriptional regulator GbsR (MarR family)
MTDTKDLFCQVLNEASLIKELLRSHRDDYEWLTESGEALETTKIRKIEKCNRILKRLNSELV